MPQDQIPERCRVLAEVVRRLAERDYDGLVQDGIADEGVGPWIEDYPATLVPLPDEAFEHGDAVAIVLDMLLPSIDVRAVACT